MEIRPLRDSGRSADGACFFLASATLLLGVAAGLVLAPPPGLSVGAAALAILASVLISARNRLAVSVAYAAVGVAIAAVGVTRPSTDASLAALADREIVIEGTVHGLPCRGRETVEADLDLRRIAADGRVREARTRVRATIITSGTGEAIAPGDILRIRGTLREIPGKRFPGGRNGRWAALAEGYRLSVWTEAGPRCVVIKGVGSGFDAAVHRHLLPAHALFSGAGSPAGDLLEALVLGSRRMLTAEVEEEFRKSGLAHLLSISGVHVSMLGWLVYLVLGSSALAGVSGLEAFRLRRIAALLAIPPVLLYTFISGAEAPAVRSCIMVTCFFVGVAVSRTFDGRGGLALAAVGLVALAPTVLAGPSFQLSFLAVAMILAGSVVTARRGRGRRPGGRVIGWLQDYLVMSLSAVVGTLPLAAFHFGEVSLNGLAAGILALPLTGMVILPAGLAAALMAPWWPGFARLLLLPAATGCQWLLGLSSALASWRWGIVHWRPSPLAVMALYGVLAGILVMGGSRIRWKSAAAIGAISAAAVVIVDTGIGRPGSADMRVTFLDVGQGDAALVETARGEAFLIDCGGKTDFSDKGRSVVVPFLRARGIRHLKGVIVSHAHPDHIGGLAAVTRSIDCDAVYAPLPCLETRRAVPMGMTVHGVVGRASLANAGCRVTLLPSRPAAGRNVAELSNDVMQLCRFDACWSSALFAGDAGAAFLDAVSGEDIARPTLALKVPHHGSRHSLSAVFLRSVRPSRAIISAGRNSFGHPHRQVLEHLAGLGADPLVTRDRGTIEIECRRGGQSLAVWDGRTDALSPRGLAHWFIRGY